MFEREMDVAKAAARAAGEVIRAYYGTPIPVRDKGKDDPVTPADREADAAIRTLVTAMFPDDGWLSEETTDSAARLTRRRVWIVDPLDGTKEFLGQVPEFCVCVALVHDGDPVVAVSYDPVRDHLYAARCGAGTTINGKKTHTTATSDLASARVLASRSENARGEWTAYKPHVRVVPTGSVAFKLARLAAGGADATFTLSPKNEWDICSGTLLVREAGGTVTDTEGRDIRFNRPDPLRPGLIASNGHLHAPLRGLIARLAGDD